ncbi:AraC family transcriptional regulator [Clostridium grantii]|uniref:AraC-type DNA-binding protein n=1 Tax=Clostridium grantii DSM 8605 TaxID=1121316 RepID=A0A1M5XWX7_9CLOT|nr:AraC family transcriptional regulator [Clostridium grantii]SHI03743.1 AraC-type DNA-binding protein [Clostridium grantii DSM 8605]
MKPTHEIITTNSNLPVCFRFYHSSNQLISSHWHSHLEILYIYKGAMHIARNDKEYELYQKDLFIVNSGFIHFTKCIGNVEAILLQIPYDLLNQSLPNFSTIQFEEYYSHKKYKNHLAFQEMVQNLLTMNNLNNEKKTGYQFLFNSNLHLFLHKLYTNFTLSKNEIIKPTTDKYRERLQIIIDYVNKHYMEPIALATVASLVALNPEYFCRSFKKNMGFTFVEYVNLVRLIHIYNDILGTNDSIIQIQERHGFTNYKVFNRMFKETYGCTPSKLRKDRHLQNSNFEKIRSL